MNAYTPIYIAPAAPPPSTTPVTPAPLDPFAQLFVFCVLVYAAWAVVIAIFTDPKDK